MQVVTAAEQLFFTTIRIVAEGAQGGVGPDASWVGTGFAYEVQTQQGPAHMLVTNKHVLRHARQVTLSMISATPDGLPALGKAATCTVGNMTDDTWSGHPDPRVDVAVMGLSFMANLLAMQGNSPFYRCADPSISLNSTSIAELDALEEVVFVGYPSGLYDTTNLLPIVRRGMTATPITVDYKGLPAFLIDAAVFPGSSGSPVFILNQGMYRNRHNATVIGNRLILLGVLAEYYSRSIDGPVREVPAQLIASMHEALGLGTVFRAETIGPCIDQFLAQRGLARLPTQPERASDLGIAE
jgi:hypothetical protein